MNLNVSTWIGSIILDNREVTAGLKMNFIQASDGDQTKNFGHHITTSLWLHGSFIRRKSLYTDGV